MDVCVCDVCVCVCVCVCMCVCPRVCVCFTPTKCLFDYFDFPRHRQVIMRNIQLTKHN